MTLKNKEPPEVLRIKRKREQDPLAALYLETSKDNKKKQRTQGFVFKLARTDHQIASPEELVLEVAQDSSPQNTPDDNRRLFKLPSGQSDKLQPAAEIKSKESEKPPAAATKSAAQSMAESYIGGTTDEDYAKMLRRLQDVGLIDETDLAPVEAPTAEPVQRKKRRSSGTAPRPVIVGGLGAEADESAVDTSEDSEYVYDVYYRQNLTNPSALQGAVGYILMDDDEEAPLLNDVEEENYTGTDNDDSNAEDYYQNDYPENEDVSEVSDLDELEQELEELAQQESGRDIEGFEMKYANDPDFTKPEYYSDDENYGRYNQETLQKLTGTTLGSTGRLGRFAGTSNDVAAEEDEEIDPEDFVFDSDDDSDDMIE